MSPLHILFETSFHTYQLGKGKWVKLGDGIHFKCLFIASMGGIIHHNQGFILDILEIIEIARLEALIINNI